MRRLFIFMVASLALLVPASMAQTAAKHKPQPLNNAAMDQVTAGKVTAGVSDGVIKFEGSAQTRNGLVTGAGTMAVFTGPLSATQNQGTLTLNGSAQQNLNSLVNINAVNSNVNVLLNLNVNINSTIGTITQTNLTGKH